MFSKVLQPSDYKVISNIISHSHFDKMQFIYGSFISINFDMESELDDFATKLPYVKDSFLESFGKDFISKMSYDLTRVHRGRFQDIVMELTKHCQSYTFFPKKDLLNKELVLDVGSNVLIKTDNFYNALNDAGIYSNAYSNYRLLNRTELIGKGILDDDKDNFTSDEYPVFKWIPYLYDFTLPEYDDETLDSKFISMAIEQVSRSAIKDLIMDDVESMEHENYERFKIIVDSANAAVEALNDNIKKAQDEIISAVTTAIEYETSRRKIKGMLKDIAHYEGVDDNDCFMAKNIEDPFSFQEDLRNSRKLRLKLEGIFAHVDVKKENTVAALLMYIRSFNQEWEPSQELINCLFEYMTREYMSYATDKILAQFNRLLFMAWEIDANRWEDLKITRLKADGTKEKIDFVNKIVYDIVKGGKGITADQIITIIKAYDVEGVIGVELKVELPEPKALYKADIKEAKEYFSRHHGLTPITEAKFAKYMPSGKVSKFI